MSTWKANITNGSQKTEKTYSYIGERMTNIKVDKYDSDSKIESFDYPVTYDEIGNMTSFQNYTYQWQNGRELKNIKINWGGDFTSYKYNEDSIRIEKNVNGAITKYYLEGDSIAFEERYDAQGNIKKLLHYVYDENGNVLYIQYKNCDFDYPSFDETYYLVRNAQNDVVALVLTVEEGIYKNDIVAYYSYDAWGNLESVGDGNGKYLSEQTDADHIGIVNPIRYRGYYYDTETKLYYLQSRYYNPEICRFINADGAVSTGQGFLGYNMYAYCLNNPVNLADPAGQFAIVIGLIVVGAIALGTAIVALCDPKVQQGISQGVKEVGSAVKKGFDNLGKKITSGISVPNVVSKPISKSEEQRRKNDDTVIYRWGKQNNKNLTPKLKDLKDGALSFSLAPPVGQKYCMTTVKAVNATGILHAKIDGVNHVSVYPVIPGTFAGWVNSRETADTNPHPYTQTLMAIVWSPEK